MRAVKALLGGAIDYAGLFPPAALDLETTVGKYAAYRAGADAWALGRFVLPSAKLAEFVDRWPEHVRDWPISLLIGSDYGTELELAMDAGLRLDAVECRPAKLGEIGQIRRLLPASAMLFVEAGVDVDAEELLAAIADAGASAKLRTGGVVRDAIPEPRRVAEFLVACARRELRMKATAGLHHAVRGEYRLTYEADSAAACMHGFVNFFVGAVAAENDAPADEVERILADGSRESFSATDDAISWSGTAFSTEAIQRARERLAISFGSCSFEEPIGELRAMGWIE